MFKPETLKKYVDKMNQLIACFMAMPNFLEKYSVCFSTGDKKFKALNVSLPPIFSCGHCQHCKGICYDIKCCLRFPGAKELGDNANGAARSRAINWCIWKKDPERYFSDIRKKVSNKRSNLFMRWHQGGETPSYDYCCEMVAIARENPKYESFWAYSKEPDMWNEYIRTHGGSMEKAFPSNFHVLLSVWKEKIVHDDGTVEFRVIPVDNPYGLPTYEVQFDGEDYTPKGFHCCGDCNWCMANHRGCVWGESSWNHQH